MAHALTVLARGAATGIFLVRAESAEVDHKGNPRFTLYFLSWRGVACSARLHGDLLHAAGELTAFEDAADTAAQGNDGKLKIEDALRHAPKAAEDAGKYLRDAWGRLTAICWSTVPDADELLPQLREYLPQDGHAAQALLGFGENDALVLEDETLSPKAVVATWRKNAQDIVDAINGIPALTTGLTQSR